MRRLIPQPLNCGYADCGKQLPGPYGTPGVSLSRADNKTLLCSDCGLREALEPQILHSDFKGGAELLGVKS